MLRLKVFKVLLVSLVVWRLLVLGQFRIVLLFCTIGLSFAAFAFLGGQDLPFLTDYLGNLGEGKILSLQRLSHLCYELVDFTVHQDKTHDLRR